MIGLANNKFNITVTFVMISIGAVGVPQTNR